MKKVVRNMSSEKNKAFWGAVERSAEQVKGWPHWRRAGINVAQERSEPREVAPASAAHPGDEAVAKKG